MKNIRNSIIILLITLSMNLSGQFSDYINNLNGIVKQTINRESSYSGPITIIRDYNKNGLLKVESVYNGNDLNKDSLKSRNKFTYKLDDKKRISEILIVNQEKEKRKKIIKYKHSYYTVKTLWKENQKWKSYDDVKKFTNNHKEYKTKVILELGMFHEYYKWNKDKTQLLQMRFETDEEGWDEYTINYSYNDYGLLVNKENKVKVDSLFDIQFHIDSLGDIHNEYIFNSAKSDSYNIEYKYDEYDNCIEEKMIHHDGSICITTFQFQYDEQDNWIKKEEYRNGELKDTQIREIIYFN
jgi:hypothetical protein